MADKIKMLKGVIVASIFFISPCRGLLSDWENMWRINVDFESMPLATEDVSVFVVNPEEKLPEKKTDEKYKWEGMGLKEKKVYRPKRVLNTCARCRRYRLCRKRGGQPLCTKPRRDPDISIMKFFSDIRPKLSFF